MGSCADRDDVTTSHFDLPDSPAADQAPALLVFPNRAATAVGSVPRGVYAILLTGRSSSRLFSSTLRPPCLLSLPGQASTGRSLQRPRQPIGQDVGQCVARGRDQAIALVPGEDGALRSSPNQVRSLQCTPVAMWQRDSPWQINALSFSGFPSWTQTVALAYLYAPGGPCAATGSCWNRTGVFKNRQNLARLRKAVARLLAWLRQGIHQTAVLFMCAVHAVSAH